MATIQQHKAIGRTGCSCGKSFATPQGRATHVTRLNNAGARATLGESRNAAMRGVAIDPDEAREVRQNAEGVEWAERAAAMAAESSVIEAAAEAREDEAELTPMARLAIEAIERADMADAAYRLAVVEYKAAYAAWVAVVEANGSMPDGVVMRYNAATRAYRDHAERAAMAAEHARVTSSFAFRVGLTTAV